MLARDLERGNKYTVRMIVNCVSVVVLVLYLTVCDQARSTKPAVYHLDAIYWYPYCNAVTLPPFGIFVEENSCDEKLMKHEMAHWRQFQTMGIFDYYGSYLCGCITDGCYDQMMEIEAREASTQ